MRAFFTLSALCLAFACVSAYPQQSQSVDPAYLRQYYAHLAQANRESPEATPIYENSNQEAAPQYQQQRHDQARAQQASQGYVAPQIRQQYQPAPQVQYVQPQQQLQSQSFKQPAPAQKQTFRTQNNAQRLREEEEDDIGASYQFGFDVKDDEFTNYQNRKEVRDNGVIKGSYSVVDSDGFIRTVTYTADPKEGFKAEVVREPTDIVVKIPPPHQASQNEQLRHQNHQYPSSGYKQQPQQQQLKSQQPQQYPHQYE